MGTPSCGLSWRAKPCSSVLPHCTPHLAIGVGLALLSPHVSQPLPDTGMSVPGG